MDGPQHYRIAEKCLEAASDTNSSGSETTVLLAQAQVHATLALAAATALDADRGSATDSWREALGIARAGAGAEP